MTTHELARKLLEGADLPAVVRAYGSNDHLGFIEVDEMKKADNEEYVSEWTQGKYSEYYPNKEYAGQPAPWRVPVMATGDVIAIL